MGGFYEKMTTKRKYQKRGDLTGKLNYRRREKVEEELHSKKQCLACHQTLKQDCWNTAVDILLCENPDCTQYRIPAGSVPIIRTSMEQILKEAKERRFE